MTPLLAVSQLRFECPDSGFILGPLSLEVEKGEAIAIIGENQSGKSLLAKLLTGSTKPQSGDIELNTNNHDTQHRSAIRMMFQFSSSAMNPGLSVGKILSEPLIRNTNLDEQARINLIEKTLVQVGLLREHAYYYRHMLSDGQQQRVALARAIILSPRILIADEPFAALDPSIRSQTVNLILDLQKQMGLSFVFISHNLGIVRHIADRVMVLDDGQIVEMGKTDTIFRWPKHSVTKRLIQSHQSLVPKPTLT